MELFQTLKQYTSSERLKLSLKEGQDSQHATETVKATIMETLLCTTMLSLLCPEY